MCLSPSRPRGQSHFHGLRRENWDSPRERLPRIVVGGLLVACVVLLTGCDAPPAALAQPTPVQVTVSQPLQREVVDYEDFTGRTEAVESVEIRARVTGYLDQLLFKEGAEVKKGDLLFQIDPRPFQAEHNQALSQVVLRQANLKFREAELARNKLIFAKGALTQSELDQSVAARDEALAAVAAAEASTEYTKLNLEFTRIAAPVDGRISRAQVTPGNLVQADQTLLTTLVSVDPMYVYFDVDERAILRIQTSVREGKIQPRQGKEIPVLMGLATEEGFPHHGTIDFGDNRVDPSTGTIRVRGVFANPKPDRGDRVLMPGLFARVRVPVGDPYAALMVAERALGTDQGQKLVYVVNDKKEVEYRPVKIGKLYDGLRVVEEGLRAGEQVIVNGLQRVRPGATVEAKGIDMTVFAGPERPEAKPPRPEPAVESPVPAGGQKPQENP